MVIESEHALFERTLQEYYGIQHALDDLQPELASSAVDQDVEDFFSGHHEATREQRTRAESAFEAINAEPTRREPAILDGIREDRAALSGDIERADLDDFTAVETGKAIERTEITYVETLLVLADRIDLDGEVTSALEQSKTEAENALETLQELSVGY